MVSRKLLFVASLVLFVSVFGEDSSSTVSSSTDDHPKGLKKREGGSFKKPGSVLSPEKFKAIFEIYEKEGESLEEKNKKIDELTAKYSDEEKKAVEGIKKHAAKRAELVAKLSDESKAILKEVRGLKKQEHEALKKVDKKDLPIVFALLNSHKHSHSPPRPFGGKKPQKGSRGGSKSTGKSDDSTSAGEVTATSASA